MVIPTEIVIYIEEIRKFVDFEQADPKFMMKFFFDIDIKKYLESKKIQLTKASETTGLSSGSFIQNMRIPIFAMLMALMVLLLAVLAMVVVRNQKWKDKIKKILMEKKKAFMWNNTINSLTIAFMSLVLTMYAKFIQVRV